MTQKEPARLTPEETVALFEADLTSRYPHRRMKTIADVIPMFEALGRTEEAQHARWEAMLFSMHRREAGQEESLGGRFGPVMVVDGRRTTDLPDFLEEAWAYFEKRLSESKNPILRSWYADALWEKKHHHLFARAAIQAHLDCNPIYVRNEWWHEATDALTRALKLAARLNDRDLVRTVKDECFAALKNLSGIRRHPQVRWCLEIIDALLVSEKFLDTKDLEALAPICQSGEKFYLSPEAGQDHYIARCFVERASQVQAKLKHPTDVADAKKRIGAIWEEEAAMKGAKDNLLSAMLLEKAIEHYANIGESGKVEELKVTIRGKYAAANDKGEFKAISTEVKIPVKDIEDGARSLLKAGLENALLSISADESLIPDIRESRELAKDINTKELSRNNLPIFGRSNS